MMKKIGLLLLIAAQPLCQANLSDNVAPQVRQLAQQVPDNPNSGVKEALCVFGTIIGFYGGLVYLVMNLDKWKVRDVYKHFVKNYTQLMALHQKLQKKMKYYKQLKTASMDVKNPESITIVSDTLQALYKKLPFSETHSMVSERDMIEELSLVLQSIKVAKNKLIDYAQRGDDYRCLSVARSDIDPAVFVNHQVTQAGTMLLELEKFIKTASQVIDQP